jgi:molecular chaperone DnaK
VVASEHQIDLRGDTMALQRLRDAAEKAKMRAVERADRDQPALHHRATGGSDALHLQKTLTREKPRRARRSTSSSGRSRSARKRSKSAGERSTTSLLVGGMTRMPLVQKRSREFFGKRPLKGVNPDEVVALGAASRAARCSTDSQSVLLLDVTPHSLGIMIVGGHFSVLIEQNTTVPTAKSHIFTTVRDNQTSVKILVLAGRERSRRGERPARRVHPDGAPAGAERRGRDRGHFDINADGIVSVSAKDLETGQQQAITVTATSGLTEDEIKRMMEENREYLVDVRTNEELEMQASRSPGAA